MAYDRTYSTTELSRRSRDRAGEHRFDLVAANFLAAPEITDRDRIAIALRELRRTGYETETMPFDLNKPIDWAKDKVIRSLYEPPDMAFGDAAPSALARRLMKIARRAGLAHERRDLVEITGDLYEESALVDLERYATLREPYVFYFKGSPELVEAVFQGVGFATTLRLRTFDDGSEALFSVEIAQPEPF